ncbi:natural killer cells antigen CD94-like [Elephas maximus indicus]|uniref:natural killer cells antigen CD94-like n=1 Tax=Elephas maximus indicus TaxID=99487 RepID=UPI0021166AF3|nr:natural killer cells antigen CD94-like [Elephas maximus indicus]
MREESVTYSELRLQTSSQRRRRTPEVSGTKGIKCFEPMVFQTTPWRLISGIFGGICLLLMAILAILLNNWQVSLAFSPGLIIELQADSDCCSCPEKWIGYRCSCYLILNEEKTWAESRNFCASQNSSLLQLKSRDELDFLNYRRQFYWLGISYNETHDTWLWEDDSAPSQDLFSFFQTLDPKKCIVHSPNKEILDEPCGGKRPYICEQQLI